MIIVSEITFTGNIGDPITDPTSGVTPVKTNSGLNTIDLDGLGNGVFTCVQEASGQTQNYLVESVVSATDLLDKDFKITLTDFVVSESQGIMPFIYVTNGGTLAYILSIGLFGSDRVVLFNSTMTAYINWQAEHDIDITVPHAYVLAKTAGIYSCEIDGVSLGRHSQSGSLDSTPFSAGYMFAVGNANTNGNPYVTNIGNFKMQKDGGTPPVTVSSGSAEKVKNNFQRF